MKKVLFLLALICLLAACAPAAAPSDGSSTPPPAPPPLVPVASEPQEIVWCILAQAYDYNKLTPMLQEIESAVNGPLADAMLKLKIVVKKADLMYYGSEIEKYFASDEKCDLLTLYTSFTPVYSFVERNYFKNLSGVIERYPNLAEALDETQMGIIKYRGGNYVIPSAFSYRQNNEHSYLAARTDVLSEIGIESIATFDDLVAAMSAARDKDLPYKLALFYSGLHEFRRCYPEFPFRVSDDLMFYFDMDGNVEAYVKSDIIYEDHQFMSRLREIAPDAILTDGFKNSDEMFDTFPNFIGSSYFSAGSYGYQNPDGLKIFQLAPEAPQVLYVNPLGYAFCAVPADADGYLGLQFLDWVYASGANYDLVRYGTDGGSENALGSFIFQNKLYALADETSSQLNDKANIEKMPWDGFKFDPSPVQKLYDDMIDHYLYSGDFLYIYGGSTHGSTTAQILNGFYGVNLYMYGEAPIEELSLKIKQLESHGLDEIVEECKRQYAEFLAKKEM